MRRSHQKHHHAGFVPRGLLPRSLNPLHNSDDTSDMGQDPTLVKRTPPPPGGGGSGSGGGSGGGSASTTTSSSSSSTTCAPGDDTGICQKPTDTASPLPIVLAVVIPIVVICIVFYFLHRRHLKKLQNEARDDKYKSYDFGMDTTNELKGEKPGRKGRKNKGQPETNAPDMSYEKGLRGGRGMSIDMGSPYLLPPELHNSRDSLHSLTRSIHSHEDRYKPATTFVSNDTSSIRSFPSKRGMDDSSIYTGSSGIGLGHQDGMHDELLKNPQRISRSSLPQRGASLARHKNPDSRVDSPTEPMPEMPELAHTLSQKDSPGAPTPPPKSGGLVPPSTGEEPRDSYIEKDGGDMRRSNNYLGTFINTRESSVASDKDTSSRNSPQDLSMPLPPVQHNDDRRSPTPVTLVHPDDANLGRQLSHKAPVIHVSEEHHYPEGSGDFSNGFKVTPPSLHRTSDPDYEDPHEQYHDGNGMANGPLEGAEVHDGEDYGGLDAPALGYDLRRLSMGFRPLPPEDPSDDPEQRANRIRSFYKEYFDESKQAQANEDYFGDYGDDYYEDAAFYDPETGEYIMANAPYMDPIPRRAMTPPPRAPPRFQGAARHGPSMSSGFLPPGPRAYSSQSGRMPGGLGGPGGRRPPPKKRLPPPSPLRNLPTPHLLKEDSFALPIDFAPPRTYKERREGRPESPVVGLRPYSPALPAHLPLVSSFDDLAMMPSPHALRKSGTFTALDFAPPPRFRNADTGSDAGSIRSNRSAMSATHLQNIRTGAYRVSRLPKQTVGTKVDLMAELKPKWDMRR